MKKAFADKFKEATEKSLWTVLENEFSNGFTAVQAAEKLIKDFGTKVHPGALNRLVEKALSGGKINKEKFSGFVCKRRKKHPKIIAENKSNESNESNEPNEPNELSNSTKSNEPETENLHVLITGICSECGNETKFHALKNFPTKKDFIMGLGARTCPKCGKFKTLIGTCVIDGVSIKKAIVLDKDGCQSEEFVDSLLQIIPSPFACV